MTWRRSRFVFAGIDAGDIDLATQYIDHKRFVQHNPYAAEGVTDLARFIRQSPRDQFQLALIRALKDDPYVVTQTKGAAFWKGNFLRCFQVSGWPDRRALNLPHQTLHPI